jgi:hypothetical protein
VNVFRLSKLQCVVLLLNAVFWIWFWTYVFHLPRHQPSMHPAMFLAFGHEDPWPGIVFFDSVLRRWAVLLHVPVFVAISLTARFLPEGSSTVIPGFNAFGLRVVWATVLSFLQWYWIARGLEWIWFRIHSTRARER